VISTSIDDPTDIRPLVVIPEPTPGTRSILTGSEDRTVVMTGDGHVVYACGGCGAPLLEGVHIALLFTMLVRCGRCGRYNATPS
jgi:hypothetical protein